MDFCLQLGPYTPDNPEGGAQALKNVLEQAKLADRLGFESVALTEHHLINLLMMPAPLQLAVLIATYTKTVKILTSVAVLPLHDMRIFAGEVSCADIFTDGRMMLGVGRGAFAFEMERLGVAMEDTLPIFNESLDVLQKLLSQKEVSWQGDHYHFDSLTIMPRPITPGGPQMMMAVLNPEGVYHCTKRGFHIQTTPLAGRHQLLVDLVEHFTRARSEMGGAGKQLTLSLSRVGLPCTSKVQQQHFLDCAESYYARFDNLFTGPGIVEAGMAKALPRKQTRAELSDSLLICSVSQMVDQLGEYQKLGLDRCILNINFGVEQSAVLEGIQCFAEWVMPHFTTS